MPFDIKKAVLCIWFIALIAEMIVSMLENPINYFFGVGCVISAFAIAASASNDGLSIDCLKLENIAICLIIGIATMYKLNQFNGSPQSLVLGLIALAGFAYAALVLLLANLQSNNRLRLALS